MPPPAISFRPVSSADAPFLREIYCSTRWEELALSGWSDEEKRAFLVQQFEFQSRDWERNYPRMQRQIVVVDGFDAGRLYIDRRERDRDLRVVDIALLPPFRNRGVATRIFTDLFVEMDECGWKTSIHVEHQNPAKNLYTRLGLEPRRKTNGVYLLMERPAAGAPLAQKAAG